MGQSSAKGTTRGFAQAHTDTFRFPVFVHHKPANDGGPAYNELAWHSTEMLDLKHFKEAMVLYSLHSPLLKEMLNTWAMQNRVIPQDWKSLVSAVL